MVIAERDSQLIHWEGYDASIWPHVRSCILSGDQFLFCLMNNCNQSSTSPTCLPSARTCKHILCLFPFLKETAGCNVRWWWNQIAACWIIERWPSATDRSRPLLTLSQPRVAGSQSVHNAMKYVWVCGHTWSVCWWAFFEWEEFALLKSDGAKSDMTQSESWKKTNHAREELYGKHNKVDNRRQANQSILEEILIWP